MNVTISPNEHAFHQAVAGSVPRERHGQTILLRRRQALRPTRGQTDQCFRVQTGAMRVCRPLVDGRRQITAFLFPGDWIGLDEVYTLNTSFEAISCTEVERFSLHMQEDVAPSDLATGPALRDMLRARLAAVQSRLLTLGHKNAREKLACFLLEMSERLAGGDDAFMLPMSRYDIADYLCLSSETVCRNFTQLMTSGIIALPEPKRVHILRRGPLEFIGQ